MEVDNNKVYTWANSGGIEFFGEDVIGKEATFYFEGKQDTYDTVTPIFCGSEDIIYVESWQRRQDGEKRLLSWWCRVLKNEEGKVTGALSTARDITDLKRAEEALRKSEEKFRELSDSLPQVVFEMDLRGILTYVNRNAFDLFGYTQEDFINGMNALELVIQENREEAGKNIGKIMQGEILGGIEYTAQKKNGETFPVEIHSRRILHDGKPIGLRGIIIDITERKQADKVLRESEEKYRELVRYAPAGIYEIDYETNRFISVNDIICEYTGYSRDELFTMNLFNLLTIESQQLMLTRLEKLMAGEKLDPTVEYCIRSKNGNELWGLFNARYIYEAGKLKGSTGVIYDITDRKRAEKELQQTLESLRRSLGTTIRVMVSAVESRDPYTAGHQVRSANLARAIAMEMGLPQEKIDGIRMAGSIHDIGKLSIPAEILSKPTKLTNIEFSLIKVHSEKGYEMLKDVESPWPLADIVYQHHERMDGSGYPRNLKGDEILMEARILAVADVVEAMASHRPYRPAIGLNAALEEIENHKGTLYDTDVVDTCLRLFREKGFQLEGCSQ